MHEAFFRESCSGRSKTRPDRCGWAKHCVFLCPPITILNTIILSNNKIPVGEVGLAEILKNGYTSLYSIYALYVCMYVCRYVGM